MSRRKINKYLILDGSVHIYFKNGQVGLIDIDDMWVIEEYHWSACEYKKKGTFYALARCRTTRKTVKMHRVIMSLTDSSLVIDHINGNTLDNRKSNLRVCTTRENTKNRVKSGLNTSGYKGVYLNKLTGRWIARIRVDYKRVYIGTYETPELAWQAYKLASIKYHGDYGNVEE